MNSVTASEGGPLSQERAAETSLRLSYAAVPLDPWKAKHPNNPEKPYYEISIENVKNIAFEAMVRLSQGKLIPHILGDKSLPHRLENLGQFVENSLVNAQNDRIKHNRSWAHPEKKPHGEVDSELYLPEMVDIEDPLVRKALIGTAEPNELLEILLRYPNLPSIELAKLSHPFEFAKSTEMEHAIAVALADAEFDLPEDEQLHYKNKKSIDYALGALILVRKRVVAQKLTDMGLVEVVERRSLLVMDSASCDIVSKDYVIDHGESEEGLAMLASRVEEQLGSDDFDECTWLFPTTTSYYARYRR